MINLWITMTSYPKLNETAYFQNMHFAVYVHIVLGIKLFIVDANVFVNLVTCASMYHAISDALESLLTTFRLARHRFTRVIPRKTRKCYKIVPIRANDVITI